MQATSQHHAAYRNTQVSSASPLRIVILLYEGAVRFMMQAEQNFDSPSVRGMALGRAHSIVAELLSALNHDEGQDISRNLDGLYNYALDEITRANVDSDPKAVASVIDVLKTLLEGWRGVEQLASRSKASP